MNIKQIIKTNKVYDMSIKRDLYKTKCLSHVDETLIHLAKICVFPNGPITRWKDELFSHISLLFSYDLKEDQGGKVRKKCFIDNFIFGFFDEDFSGYHKMVTIFNIAIRKEGKKVKDFDLHKLVNDNEERILTFYNELMQIPHNLSEEESNELIDACIDRFADWNK